MYEEVAEDEYSDMVRKRQEDDWIVDDGECGTAEMLTSHHGSVSCRVRTGP